LRRKNLDAGSRQREAASEALTLTWLRPTCGTMRPVETELFTVADYRAMPEGPPFYQLVEGELIMSPAPNFRHQVIAKNVFAALHGYLQRQRLGEAYFAPVDVFLSENDVVQPDVFFLSHANQHLIETDGIHGAPDLVVEIVSPGSAQLDKKRKRAIYARSGVKELWLVDPVLEQIHRYDFATEVAKPVRVVDTEEQFETPLLPGLVINAADVFKR
jgi:Uma2 family endonuclease